MPSLKEADPAEKAEIYRRIRLSGISPPVSLVLVPLPLPQLGIAPAVQFVPALSPAGPQSLSP